MNMDVLKIGKTIITLPQKWTERTIVSMVWDELQEYMMSGAVKPGILNIEAFIASQTSQVNAMECQLHITIITTTLIEILFIGRKGRIKTWIIGPKVIGQS